jgi:DNA primase
MQESTDWQVYSPSSLMSADSEYQYTNMALTHYQATLLDHSKAMQYLASRGIRDRDVINRFQLGFADRSLPSCFAKLRTTEGEMIRGLLQRKGLIKSNGRETFLGMVVFPLLDERNEIVGAFGHRIAKHVIRKAPYSIWYTLQPGILYQHHLLQVCDDIILCESPFDVLSLWQVGIKHAVSLLDYKQFSHEHTMQFKVHGIRRVMIAFSHTPQGDRYFALVRLSLRKVGINVDRLGMPVDEGINSLWAKSTLFEPVFDRLCSYKASLERGECNTSKFH